MPHIHNRKVTLAELNPGAFNLPGVACLSWFKCNLRPLVQTKHPDHFQAISGLDHLWCKSHPQYIKIHDTLQISGSSSDIKDWAICYDDPEIILNTKPIMNQPSSMYFRWFSVLQNSFHEKSTKNKIIQWTFSEHLFICTRIVPILIPVLEILLISLKLPVPEPWLYELFNSE